MIDNNFYVINNKNDIFSGYNQNILHFNIDKLNSDHHEAQLLQLNCDKANKLLNWHPNWDTEQALKATALWYKSFIEGQDVEKFTLSQIEDYFEGKL